MYWLVFQDLLVLQIKVNKEYISISDIRYQKVQFEGSSDSKMLHSRLYPLNNSG